MVAVGTKLLPGHMTREDLLNKQGELGGGGVLQNGFIGETYYTGRLFFEQGK